MKMVLIVTVISIYGDSQGSFPSLATQQSRMPPKVGVRGQCGCCCFSEGNTQGCRGEGDLLKFICQITANAGLNGDLLAPSHTQAATHGLQLWLARKNGAFVRAEHQPHAFCCLGWRPKEMVSTGGLGYEGLEGSS